MQCPKCSYTCFDHLDQCPKCRKDLTSTRSLLGLLPVGANLVPYLVSVLDESHETLADSHDDFMVQDNFVLTEERGTSTLSDFIYDDSEEDIDTETMADRGSTTLTDLVIDDSEGGIEFGLEPDEDEVELEVELEPEEDQGIEFNMDDYGISAPPAMESADDDISMDLDEATLRLESQDEALIEPGFDLDVDEAGIELDGGPEIELDEEPEIELDDGEAEILFDEESLLGTVEPEMDDEPVLSMETDDGGEDLELVLEDPEFDLSEPEPVVMLEDEAEDGSEISFDGLELSMEELEPGGEVQEPDTDTGYVSGDLDLGSGLELEMEEDPYATQKDPGEEDLDLDSIATVRYEEADDLDFDSVATAPYDAQDQFDLESALAEPYDEEEVEVDLDSLGGDDTGSFRFDDGMDPESTMVIEPSGMPEPESDESTAKEADDLELDIQDLEIGLDDLALSEEDDDASDEDIDELTLELDDLTLEDDDDTHRRR